MLKIIANPSKIITVDTFGRNVKRGAELSDIGLLKGYSILIEDEFIKDIIPTRSISSIDADEIIDADGKIVLPGFVDCHTHSVFAGSRSNEFSSRLKGITYEEIAASGGGINNTVDAIRKTNVEELIKITIPRIDYFISQGITTLEIKSGYGLDFENEIKILHVIKYLNDKYPINIIPTFLGAHAFPPEYNNNHDEYINLLTNDLLPYIAKNNLAKYCDAFYELTAFNLTEIETVFKKAISLGIPLKMHTDQFNSIGGVDFALRNNVCSADHLEVIKDDDIEKLGSSDIVCVLLPGVSFFLNNRFAPARKLIDWNAIIALSTDYNPGSSNISCLNLIISLAALKMGMTIEETISAVTINAAKAVGVNKECGSIEIGKRADLALFNTDNYADIVYNVGKNLIYMTIKNGEVIYISD